MKNANIGVAFLAALLIDDPVNSAASAQCALILTFFISPRVLTDWQNFRVSRKFCKNVAYWRFVYEQPLHSMLNRILEKMHTGFHSLTIVTGEKIYQNQGVLSVRLSDGLLKARVKADDKRLYDVYMDLRAWPGQPSRCQCRYGFNCEHAVASLLALRDFRQDGQYKTSNEADMQAWLSSLRVAAPVAVQFWEIAYFLELVVQEKETLLQVSIHHVQYTKTGKRRYTWIENPRAVREDKLSSEDENIVSKLVFAESISAEPPGYYLIRQEPWLKELVATERAFFKGDTIPITIQNSKKGSLKWVLRQDGLQELVIQVDNHIVRPILLDSVWHADVAEHAFVPIDIEEDNARIRALIAAPYISFEEGDCLIPELHSLNLPTPIGAQDVIYQEVHPVGVIIFKTTNSVVVLDKTIYMTKLGFDYAGQLVSITDPHTHVFGTKALSKEGKHLAYTRDFAYEHKQYEALKPVLPHRAMTTFEAHSFGVEGQGTFILVDFKVDRVHQEILPALEAMGWQVHFEGEAYEEILGADQVTWYSNIHLDHDEMHYSLGVMVDGQYVNLIPILVKAIEQWGKDPERFLSQESVRLHLDTQRVLDVGMSTIKPFLEYAIAYRDTIEGEAFVLPSAHIGIVREIESSFKNIQAKWHDKTSLDTIFQHLLASETLPVAPLPDAMEHLPLRPYQKQGFDWLQYLRAHGLNGILADDMGLGKTLQTLMHLYHEREMGRMSHPSLVIAPTSVMDNWIRESRQWFPSLRVRLLHSSEPDFFDILASCANRPLSKLATSTKQFADVVEFGEGANTTEGANNTYDILVTNYQTVQRSTPLFLAAQFYFVILDEAQYIKNAFSKTTKTIHDLRAMHRLCLTGTPLENHLGELWSLFHFLMPGLLGDKRYFTRVFKTPIEGSRDVEALSRLMRRIRPFILRRTKDQVATELPLKTEMILSLELGERQKQLYHMIRVSMVSKVREAIAELGFARSHFVILDALLKLRQICCDPELLSIPEAHAAYGDSVKLEALMELLESLESEGRRVLVFSQFTSMLTLIEKRLVQGNIGYTKLTGQTRNRQEVIETFQKGDVPVFLISLKAGGTGLNLTQADVVIHYDPWWNPAVENQATDRAHRIGQDKPVMVYKMIVKDTVEEVMLNMQRKKRALFEDIVSNTSHHLGAWDVSDIEMLLNEGELI
jgi:superfamily II DNA or RNA helicase